MPIESTDSLTTDPIALVEATRKDRLRHVNDTDLRNLMRRLTEACDNARGAALRALSSQESLRSVRVGDKNFGFAQLYSALRRVRAESRKRSEAKQNDGEWGAAAAS